MNRFSQKTLMALGDCYVYGLIDPRNNRLFYIGKGTGNRIFEHEFESLNNPDSDKLKLKTIKEIKDSGYDVKKIIINYNLTESEAIASEASLINIFKYIEYPELTNVVSGHHSHHSISVEEFERIHGAVELEEDKIKHNLLVIKINRIYHNNMTSKELYDAVRGIWRISISKAKKIDYVLGVYKSIIVAVYKPSYWLICKENLELLPRDNLVIDEFNGDRKFFIDNNFETIDDNKSFYLGKSINKLKVNQSAQNPITYIWKNK